MRKFKRKNKIYICSIDFKKTFDNVRHDILVNLLKKQKIDINIIKIIDHFYTNQKANVKLDDQITNDIEIKKGARQGCILSPIFFNIYSENIIERDIRSDELIKMVLRLVTKTSTILNTLMIWLS